jgi:hypothetical protein
VIAPLRVDHSQVHAEASEERVGGNWSTGHGVNDLQSEGEFESIACRQWSIEQVGDSPVGIGQGLGEAERAPVVSDR